MSLSANSGPRSHLRILSCPAVTNQMQFARCSTGSVADLHVPQYPATITVDDPLPPNVAIAPVTIRTIVVRIRAIIVGISITIVATIVGRGEQSAGDRARG